MTHKTKNFMTVRDFVKQLTRADLDKRLVVSSDEELNTLYGEWQVAKLTGEKKPTLVIYGLSTTEIQDE